MSFGFKTLSSSGTQNFSSADFSMAILDVFEVNPSSSGSRVYANTLQYKIYLIQSQVEPVTLNISSLLSFNSVNTSSYKSGIDTVINWSPSKQVGTLQNVIIYVLGN